MTFYEQRCEIQIARRERTYQSDLLVLGLHIHSLCFIRLWNHTTHDLVQQLSSGFLGGIRKAGAAAFLTLAIHAVSNDGKAVAAVVI
jgi:hypothetical protein